jgi:hypothetical protein
VYSVIGKSRLKTPRAQVYFWTAVWFATFVISGAVVRATPWNAAAIRQVMLLAVFAFTIVSLPNIAVHIASFGTAGRLVLITITGIMLMSQISERNVQTYPFVSWDMYTELESEPGRYFELRLWGRTADGGRVPIRYRADSPGLLYSTTHGLNDLTSRYETASEADRARLKPRIQGTLRVLGARHNRKHPDSMIDEITFEVTVVTVDWRNKSQSKMLIREWREPIGEFAP